MELAPVGALVRVDAMRGSYLRRRFAGLDALMVYGQSFSMGKLRRSSGPRFLFVNVNHIRSRMPIP